MIPRTRCDTITRRVVWEAEAIRDSLLAVSGALDPRLYGRSIRPPRIVEDSKKTIVFSVRSMAMDVGRCTLRCRSWSRPKFLVGFNLPDLKLPTGRRDDTKVPAQALIMLNDPFVIQQAEYWARKLIADDSKNVDERIQRMFRSGTGSSPEPGRSSSCGGRRRKRLRQINRCHERCTSVGGVGTFDVQYHGIHLLPVKHENESRTDRTMSWSFADGSFASKFFEAFIGGFWMVSAERTTRRPFVRRRV